MDGDISEERMLGLGLGKEDNVNLRKGRIGLSVHDYAGACS